MAKNRIAELPTLNGDHTDAPPKEYPLTAIERAYFSEKVAQANRLLTEAVTFIAKEKGVPAGAQLNEAGTAFIVPVAP